jgi:hypothetical protein
MGFGFRVGPFIVGPSVVLKKCPPEYLGSFNTN